jgi:hypothetical protein
VTIKAPVVEKKTVARVAGGKRKRLIRSQDSPAKMIRKQISYAVDSDSEEDSADDFGEFRFSFTKSLILGI